jgi:nitroreductase
MKNLECIKTRRSRRKFLSKEVSSDLIEKIVDAGKYAPSSMNSQPWKFYIIKNQNLKKKFADINYEENKEPILTCDFILVICVDKEESPARFIEDGVLASQNMSLTIHDLGLGSVYLSGYKTGEPKKEKDIQKIFNIPAKYIPICLLLTGYPDSNEELENKILKANDDLIEYK